MSFGTKWHNSGGEGVVECSVSEPQSNSRLEIIDSAPLLFIEIDRKLKKVLGKESSEF